MQTTNHLISNLKDIQVYFNRNGMLSPFNMIEEAINQLLFFSNIYGRPDGNNFIISLSPEKYKQYCEFLIKKEDEEINKQSSGSKCEKSPFTQNTESGKLQAQQKLLSVCGYQAAPVGFNLSRRKISYHGRNACPVKSFRCANCETFRVQPIGFIHTIGRFRKP